MVVNISQVIATASFFLACKVRDTPCFLKDVVVVAYEMVHKLDPSALQSIRQRVCRHPFYGITCILLMMVAYLPPSGCRKFSISKRN